MSNPDITTDVSARKSFGYTEEQQKTQPKMVAAGARPDRDTSSHYGYDEAGRFDPFSELPPVAKSAPAPSVK